MAKKNSRYGWIPDMPDHRDVMYSARVPVSLPAKVDLRPGTTLVYDQTTLGSCTANAIGGAHYFNQVKQGSKASFVPSRLFVYFNERAMEGTVNEDAGAMIRDGIKSVVKQGVCPETEWPYDVSRFRDKPVDSCYAHALEHQVVSYQRISPVLAQMKTCLASGYPFVFGFAVYESFETDEVKRTGMMPMPGGSQLGGHAVMAVGYDDSIGRVIVRNSWGEGWGDKGDFYMPYQYIANTNLCDDFWTIRTVETETEPAPGPVPEPPKPEPKKPCDWSLFLPATKAFVDGAVGHAEMLKKIGDGYPASTDRMIEAGLRGLQQYLQRVQNVRDRHV